MSEKITAEDLTEEQIERVINSQGFQKMLAYQKLADGIDVLRDQDEIYESMVTSITKQHGQVRSEDSVEEVLELFVDEVRAFAEPLADDGGESEPSDLEDLYVEESDG
jgi:hypothetical protein